MTATDLANKIHEEIHRALENNYDVRAKRMARPSFEMNDEFTSYCDGKIAALRGIDDFIEELMGDDDG